VLRQQVQFMARRRMDIDVERRCGTGCDEKSAERTISRNGWPFRQVR
jgi:putative transposase